MDRESARREIRENISCLNYLEKSQKGNYCCPFCGSGKGKSKTGAVKYYPATNTVSCFAGCATEAGTRGKSYDVIDLYMAKYGTDYNTALQSLAGEMGLQIDTNRQDIDEKYRQHKEIMEAAAEVKVYDWNDEIGGPTDTAAAPQSSKTEEAGETATSKKEEPQGATQATKKDYTEYFAECAARINDPAAVAYLESRGISAATAAACNVGYDPKADPAEAGHPCPRIILPAGKSFYVGRRADGGTEYAKLNSKGGSPFLFNGNALQSDAAEIFITEGAFDALSIIEAGAAAVALNSANNADKFVKYIENHPTPADAAFVICLDSDDAGKKAAETLREGLQKLNISCIKADICGGEKDPNAALVKDRAAFIEAVEAARQQVSKRPDNVEYYIDALMGTDIEKQRNVIKTGFSEFDRQTGGLYPGLYVLPALSSLGKTTFACQMADQIAAQGHDVLFFSMEMSRLEMVSKSINRYVAKADKESGINSLMIRRNMLHPEQREKVAAAVMAYKEAVGARLSIIEGNLKCDISFIGEKIRQYIARNNTRPVVFIDYLQILQPGEVKGRTQSKREAIEDAVEQVKILSRELSITIIVISSVNRANYLAPIDFESIKESGGIEYTADAIFGLQLQVLHDPVFEEEKKIKEKRELIKRAKSENPRKLELVCLKNRYGRIDIAVSFVYYPSLDLYVEDTENPFLSAEKKRATKRI